jgi:hypothetical protein
MSKIDVDDVEKLVYDLNKENCALIRERADLLGFLKGVASYMETHPTDTILYNKIFKFLEEGEYLE